MPGSSSPFAVAGCAVAMSLVFATAASALPKTPLRTCQCSCSVVDEKGKLLVGTLPLFSAENCFTNQGKFHSTPTVPPCEGKTWTSSIYRTTECRDEADNYSKTGGTFPGTVSPTVPGTIPGTAVLPNPGTTPGTIPGAVPSAVPSTAPTTVPGAVPGTLPGSVPRAAPATPSAGAP